MSKLRSLCWFFWGAKPLYFQHSARKRGLGYVRTEIIPIFAELKFPREMYLTTEVKKQFFSEHGGSETNTGSSEAQIALFSHRINHLTEHLKRNRKDFGTQRSLIALVGKRRKLLNYLTKTDITRYRAIVAKLGLRK